MAIVEKRRGALPPKKRALGAALVCALALVAAAREAGAALVSLTRGPFLQQVGTTAATVVWKVSGAAACAARVQPFGGAPMLFESGIGTECVVPLVGLDPGVTYAYTPLADGEPVGPAAAFRTDHPALPFSFLVYGDSGNGSGNQMALRDRLLATRADFAVHTGDMIYPEALPQEWDPKFFTPYRALIRKLALWPCLGNHDVNGDGGASWRDVFVTPANNPAGSEDYYSFDYGNAHVVMLDSNMSLQPGTEQHVFLTADLAASAATWKFVAFHHSIYSSGDHMSDVGLREVLLPVLDAYGVDMVFMGHDHDYERTWPLRADAIVPLGDGTVYVTTGGGGGTLRPVGSSSFTAYAESVHHFVHVSIANESLVLEMVRTDGTIGDTFTWVKGEATACGDGRVNAVGEQCDGSDDVACPGACDASCGCPVVCGDGVREAPIEECDWPADEACPGLCIADCTCAEAPPVLEFGAVADTYIEAGNNAATVYGGSSSVSVDAAPRRIAYFRFDVETGGLPIDAATLTLRVTNGSNDGGTVYPVGDSSWRERTETSEPFAPGLRWIDVDTNADGVVDAADTSPWVPDFARPLAALGGVVLDDERGVEVTDAFADGSGAHTLAIRTASTNGATFASRQHGTAGWRPRLRVALGLECRADADCDDAVFCNGVEACVRGHCEPGVAAACADGDACTVDACDGATDACRYDPVADGMPCDDGDACTRDDVCGAGRCDAGGATVCVALDQCHAAGSCDPATGECSNPPRPDFAPCDDGDACTLIDVCAQGACDGRAPVVCLAADQCHDAGACDPATGECSDPARPDGAPCDDADACTSIDRCAAGACVGMEPVVCAALDQCHATGSCDPATGECTNPPLPDFVPCDDGNPCTLIDVCAQGACDGRAPLPCVAPDACHEAGECDPATGACVAAPRPDGSACDDGNACTTGDACVTGVCRAGAPVVCPGADQCRGASACDRETGGCVPAPRPDGTECDDGDACTRVDECRGGACAGTAPVVCAALDACNDVGTCDPLTGACTNPTRPDGTACDDGDACTRTDACVAGSCVGGAPVICAPAEACRAAGACDPATGQCSNAPRPDGTACDDGDACTRADACDAGTCVGGAAIVCAAADQCHAAGACDPASGSCSSPSLPDGTACDDGDACSTLDRCLAGACVGTDRVECPAPDACHTAGVCDPATGACAHAARADGSTCDDGDACTQIDVCTGGACVGTALVACVALDQCHAAGVCDPATGQCTNPNLANRTACVDGDRCTQGDVCLNGVCVPGLPTGCPPLDQCREIGACDPATETCTEQNKPDGTPCNDGDLCTTGDTCVGGSCNAGAAVVCDAASACRFAGECDSATGACASAPVPDGTGCDDGNACTRDDACRAGACAGGDAIDCAAAAPCHEPGVCDPATGACSIAPSPDGAACDDGDRCSVGDTCLAGVCARGAPRVCPAADACHSAGTCDAATGTCSHPARPEGTACDDGDACTRADACFHGVCTGGDPVVCAAADSCHLPGACNPATGICGVTARADGTPCDDGNACTQIDACTGGICVGAAPVVCTATGVCHDAGVCNPATGVCTTMPSADGSACDDGNLCTTGDACAAGRCMGGTAAVCTAADQCHQAGVCNPLTGRCTNPAQPSGAPCDDGAYCTETDACQVGVCRGAVRLCPAGGDPCSAGVCDENANACRVEPKPDGGACEDGAYCTVGDVCLGGRCAGAPRDCAAGAPCMTGTCDEGRDACAMVARPDGTGCEDDAYCTVGDACAAGVCAGAARDCGAAADACNDGTCSDAARACVAEPKSDGTACDDGAYCTVGDACRGGACRGSARDCGGVADQCNAGVCDESGARCIAEHRPDAASCTDGDACTRGDACRAGVCLSGAPVACEGADACRAAGVCDPATGACAAAILPDGTDCDDGDACTGGDGCVAGTCAGAPIPDGDADGFCDGIDVCPQVSDPEQTDSDGDGAGDACQCTEPAPGHCIAGGGSVRTDCWVEVLAAGGTAINRRGTRLKPVVRCADGDPACDLDRARDGRCTLGIALCFGNTDPRYPQCAAAAVRSVEIMPPAAGRPLPPDLLANAEKLAQALAGIGVEVVRAGQVMTAAVRPAGGNLCTAMVRLEIPAPASKKSKPVRRKFTIRGEDINGRRDTDRFVLICER